MTNAYRSAFIYVQNRFAGILEEYEGGYRFTYDSDYAADAVNPGVSLTLPVQSKPYLSRILFPFFDGLIPEGWLLEAAVRNWKLDRRDRFGLLLAVCFDTVGDVSIRKERT